MIRLLWIAALALFGAMARAEVPRVMTDIGPVQSLVDRVMLGVSSADVLLAPGASPHDFAFRPSDAGRLAEAEVVIWVGHDLTPWLQEPIDTLAQAARHLELLTSPGWDRLALREDAAFADTTAHSDDHDGTDHGNTDPHAWLDPLVAAVWLDHIAQVLAEADPGNATTYRANAAAGAAELVALAADIRAQLAPFSGRGYVVPHDGYHYFEARFDLPASGAIALSDAQTPGPARIEELQSLIAARQIVCVLTDPQTAPDWTDILRDTTATRTARIDAMGGGLEAGPALYPAIIHAMADALEGCLSD
jgi:zinc transport system substrate-binding protein